MSAEATVSASSVQHPLHADGEGSQQQSQSFLEALTVRRSIYALSPTSKLSDEKITSIIEHAFLHVPNAFNAQTARCLVLLGGESQKFWDLAIEGLRKTMGDEMANNMKPKIEEYKTGYGTCLFFDDQAAWDDVAKNLGEKRWGPISAMAPQWEEHSSGMHQYAVWTALSVEGLAGNLQHYNFPNVETATKQAWKLPASWKSKAQLVFGTPVGGPRQVKTFKPVEDVRMLVRKS